MLMGGEIFKKGDTFYSFVAHTNWDEFIVTNLKTKKDEKINYKELTRVIDMYHRPITKRQFKDFLKYDSLNKKEKLEYKKNIILDQIKKVLKTIDDENYCCCAFADGSKNIYVGRLFCKFVKAKPFYKRYCEYNNSFKKTNIYIFKYNDKTFLYDLYDGDIVRIKDINVL